MTNEISKWKIRISRWGTFEFEGTESEAEIARINKAKWENSLSSKWRITNQRESDKIKAIMEESFEKNGSCSSELSRKLRNALKKERILYA